MKEASRGFIQYQIAEWRDIDAFPIQTDGFQYTTKSYLDCHERREEWHKPDMTDYLKMVEDYGIRKLIAEDRIDELWIFGGPYFGSHEPSMVGPEAF